MTHHRYPTLATVTMAALVGVVVVGCSGDDDGATAAFCTARLDVQRALGGDGDPALAVAALTEAAPEAVADDVVKLGEIMQQGAEDESIFLSQESRDASAALEGAVHDDCDFTTVDIKATDYQFSAVDDSAAGPTSIRMTNDGADIHEALLFRRAEGATGTALELITADPGRENGTLEEMGVSLPALPGEASYIFAELPPGNYAIVCFVKQGVTTMEQVLSDPKGTEHIALGMGVGFEVLED